METCILDAVKSLCNFGAWKTLDEIGDDALDLFLADLTVVVTEALWKCVVEERLSESCGLQLAVHANANLGLNVETSLSGLVQHVVSKKRL